MHLAINDTMLWVEIDEASNADKDEEAGEPLSIVVLHGGPGFDHSYLRPHLSPLTDVAQVIYVDQRGQGLSSQAPLETCTIEQMADDAAAVCQALGLQRTVVLGHSFGGFVALTLALRHPEVLAGLVLVDTAAATHDTGNAIVELETRAGAEARDAAIRVFSGDTSDAALASFARLVAPHYVKEPASSHLMTDIFAKGRLAPEVAGHYFSHVAGGYDIRPQLPQIDVPALVIVGDDDWLCPPTASKTIASGLSRANLVVIPQAGHLPYGERPDAFLSAVRQFLHLLG